MDDSSDQSQTTTQVVDPQPVAPTDQPPVETPPTREPKTETPPNSVPSETPISPNPEPQTSETSQPTQPETPAPSETQLQSEETPPVTPTTETSTETQSSVSSPAVDIPVLHFPFSGNISVTFAFGAQSDNEEIKKKFVEWGIVGHNGLDFGMNTGTEVFACDGGKVIQSGDNGDFGTSITIQHSWGQSLYAHLSETKVKVDDEIQPNKVIGLSGSSGAAFGEHLHFAIKPNNADSNNGYFGFIDPAPYLSLSSQKEETKQEPQTPPTEEPKPPEQPLQETKPPETSQPVQEQPKPEETQPQSETPLPINYGPEKPVEQTPQPIEQPQQPETPQTPEVPQPNPEEIQKQVDEKLKVELDARRQKANEARAKKKEENLTKIFSLVQSKRVVTNDEVRDFLHVSQSTATNYLTEMVNRGMLKKEGERGGAKYTV